jgi:hypothetical protein
LAHLALVQWFLEPAPRAEPALELLRESFAGLLSPAWTWHDPFHDCSYEIEDGLTIRAANGRGLWHINYSAPQLLRPLPEGVGAEPGVALQTACAPATPDRPAIGGLLLWVDQTNYLRLDWGTWGTHEITFGGCVDNQDVVIGRGRLPPGPREGEDWDVPLERAHLRLEWCGGEVHALCSADGTAWYTVGHRTFPFSEGAQAGLYAVGTIDRTIYRGAYPEGTAIRFLSFTCWALAAGTS